MAESFQDPSEIKVARKSASKEMRAGRPALRNKGGTAEQ